MTQRQSIGSACIGIGKTEKELIQNTTKGLATQARPSTAWKQCAKDIKLSKQL